MTIIPFIAKKKCFLFETLDNINFFEKSCKNLVKLEDNNNISGKQD